MENKEVLAAITMALYLYENENNAQQKEVKVVGGIQSAWTLKTLVMRPQPIKVSYLKPLNK
ncbi:MAG TPA: hypothetical protein PK887_10615 [Ignavibacteriales bacterium]|jgi:hypothetical protein|nr:hypothetical protein [Ignavibacteriales bacterium]